MSYHRNVSLSSSAVCGELKHVVVDIISPLYKFLKIVCI